MLFVCNAYLKEAVELFSVRVESGGGTRRYCLLGKLFS
jgi:hypothetical protein